MTGQYLLVIVGGGTTLEAACNLGAGLSASECTEPMRTDGDGELDVFVSLDSQQAIDT